MCCPLVFEFSVGIGGFVIGLGQISLFFYLSKFRTLSLEHSPLLPFFYSSITLCRILSGTSYTFYKPTLGPRYVSNRLYNEFSRRQRLFSR